MSKKSLEGPELQNIEQFIRFITGSYSEQSIRFTSSVFHTQASAVTHDVDPFIGAKTLFYFRKNIGPSYVISHLSAVMMNRIQARPWGRKFYYSIAQSPYDLLDIFKILQELNMKPTNAMRRGFARAFEKTFTVRDIQAYQNRDGDVTLADVVRQVHPKGNETLRKLLGRKLDSASRKKIEVDLDKLDIIKKTINTDLLKFINSINAIDF